MSYPLYLAKAPSGSCFPLLAKVELENGDSVTMSELHIGDRVQTGMKSVPLSELQVRDRV